MRTTIFKGSVVLLNFFSVIYMIPFLIGELEQTSAVERLKESIKNPPCDLWDPHVYVFFDGSNKSLGEYMVSSLSIHGVLSTLTLILSHKPYRLEADRLRRKLFCSELRSQK
ncbi:hypothetical protein L5515_007312 [Caenorhabditis briggsae]|uniref:Uncharacterized protein n=1 Tax=Caenorhabditis briggsae TaxID=6238 RepID=A0AAE9JM17_CAEBR|nr:hypothetical protein L5515_007312 [Caenorhabditis briggsae]